MADSKIKAYHSTTKAIRVVGPQGQIQFNNGHYQTDDKDLQTMIESTPSYIDGVITDAEVRAENDTAVLAAKKAEAKAAAAATPAAPKAPVSPAADKKADKKDEDKK